MYHDYNIITIQNHDHLYNHAVEKPKIIKQPEVTSEGKGLKKDKVMFVRARGRGQESDLKFQWKKNSTNIPDNDHHATVTTDEVDGNGNVKSSLHIKNHSDMNGTYTCEVYEANNPGGTVPSSEAVIGK